MDGISQVNNQSHFNLRRACLGGGAVLTVALLTLVPHPIYNDK
jgi:hypothetical protein